MLSNFRIVEDHGIRKVVNDQDCVAVLYSPDFGAGWYSWNDEIPQILFSPELVFAVLEKKPQDYLYELAEQLFPDAYLGGLDDIKIEFVQRGIQFRIHEYDGAESIDYGQHGWHTA